MRHTMLAAVAGLAAITLAAPAAAVDVTFTATGAFTASWILPQSPTPDIDGLGFFRMNDVSIVFNGIPTEALIEFYDAGGGGGACAGVFCSLFDLYGPALFSGTTAAPSFVLGDYVFGQGSVTGPEVRLTIARFETGVIPEPATWAMLIAGFGLVGASLRRRPPAAA